MERTLVLAKPDAVHRGHIGETIKRIEECGLTMIGVKMIALSDEVLKEHYAHHVDKPFFPDIVKFMQASPVVAMVWEGEGAMQKVRDLAGETDSKKAATGTLRGDLGTDIQYNLIHASDSVETAETEIRRFFSDGELYHYEKQPSQFLKE